MTDTAAAKHAFISYVREDSERIDKLCKMLTAASIPHWRDRADLGPGDMWKSKIKEAISGNSLAFLACFSANSIAKDKSYQNEEITLAVEEFRQRPPGRSWLIPVRLDNCDIPEWDLGGGRTLRDINYIDLFGDDYAENVVKLIETAKQIMGLGGADAANVRAAVSEAEAGERPAMLSRLTKDMIRDPAREIELDELITQEVSAMLAGMRDAGRFPLTLTGDERQRHLLRITEIANDYWRLVEPFCASLQVAARWGTPETLSPWGKGIRALTAEALKISGGWDALLDLRYLPALMTTVVAAMASAGQNRWDNFRTLLVDNTVTNSRLQGQRVAIIEAVDPYRPFTIAAEPAIQALAQSMRDGTDIASLLQANKVKLHTPVAEWLFAILRPIFTDQFPDHDTYADASDYTDAVLGVVNQDLGGRHDNGTGRVRYFSNRWFGRSTWRYAHRHCDPVKDLAEELELQGDGWGPLRAGLFGGSAERALTAIKQYDETFKEMSSGMW